MVLVLCSCSVVSCPLVSPWRLFIIAKGLFIVAREQSTDDSVCLLDDAVGLMVQRLPLRGLPNCSFLLEARQRGAFPAQDMHD